MGTLLWTYCHIYTCNVVRLINHSVSKTIIIDRHVPKTIIDIDGA